MYFGALSKILKDMIIFASGSSREISHFLECMAYHPEKILLPYFSTPNAVED